MLSEEDWKRRVDAQHEALKLRVWRLRNPSPAISPPPALPEAPPSPPLANEAEAPAAAPAAPLRSYEEVHGPMPTGPPIDADGLAQQTMGDGAAPAAAAPAPAPAPAPTTPRAPSAESLHDLFGSPDSTSLFPKSASPASGGLFSSPSKTKGKLFGDDEDPLFKR